MLPSIMQPIYAWLVRRVVKPGDDSSTARKKTILAALITFFLLASLVYVFIYGFLNDTMGVILNLVAAGLAWLVLVLLVSFKLDFTWAANLSALAVIGWMVADTLYRGSFEQSGYILPLWGLLAPLLALVFLPIRHAIAWLFLYFGSIVVVTLLGPTLPRHEVSTLALEMLYITNALIVGTVLFLTLYYFINQRDIAYRLLRAEQAKSEQLLLNILPAEVAALLKNEPGIIADHLPAVTILFADLVSFTPLSARITPVEMIQLLNEVFTYLDTLTEKYGLEKIKTIGDCYMVAAGVPQARPDHAQAATRMALEIQSYMRQNLFQNQALEFRIGLHSGSVVAGVIGTKKLAYDLWGDAVNMASRMESHGQGGRIQITAATYELIQNDFICAPQGQLPIKGKGDLPVWYVLGEKPANAAGHEHPSQQE